MAKYPAAYFDGQVDPDKLVQATGKVGYRTDASGNTVLVGGDGIEYPLRGIKQNTIVLFGDSIINQDYPTFSTTRKLNAKGCFTWANYYLGQRFKVVDTKGYSGYTTTQLLPLFQSDVVDKAPAYVWLEPGVNDIVGSQTSAETIANLQAMITLAKNNGITVIMTTLLPNNSFNTTEMAIKYNEILNWQRNQTTAQDGVIVVDIDWMYVNPTDTLPRPSAGYTDASVHPYTTGAELIGKRIADVLDTIVPEAFIFPNFYNAGMTGDAHPIYPNPLHVTSTAVDVNDAGCTGFRAANVRVRAVGGVGTAGVASLVARTDAPGNWQQIAFTAAGTYSALGVHTDLQTPSAISLPSGWAAGDVVQAFIEVEMDAAPTEFLGHTLWIRFNGTSEWAYGMNWETSVEYLKLNKQISRGVLATPPHAIPIGCTAFQLFARSFAADASGAFTVRYGRCVVRKVSGVVVA